MMFLNALRKMKRMLSKRVCNNCVKMESPDEDTWVTDTVICFMDVNAELKYTNIHNDPPEWCRHKFEHFVAAGMTDA
jgi:hypothetical protein